MRFCVETKRPKTAIRDNGAAPRQDLSRRQGRAGEGGNAPHRQKRYDAVSRNPTSGAFPGSIPASCAFVHRSFRPASSGRRGGRPGARTVFARSFVPSRAPEAPEEVELRVREATNEFARDVMGAVIENRDDGASRIERDGQSWFRGRGDAETIMTSLGPVTYRRARYRSGASGASPVPVDESLGLVDDYLTRPAAELGLLMMVHCTAREAAAFFAKTGAMTPSVSTLQRLTLSMHECWGSLGPETLGSIREAEGIPQDATTASVSLDGVMVPLRPGEDGRAKASLARGRLRHGLLPRRRGQAPEDPLSRPHAGERQAHAEGAACKRSRTQSGEHAPRSGSSLSPMAPPTTGPSWRPCRPKPR